MCVRSWETSGTVFAGQSAFGQVSEALSSDCQGEGRRFESGRPLDKSPGKHLCPLPVLPLVIHQCARKVRGPQSVIESLDDRFIVTFEKVTVAVEGNANICPRHIILRTVRGSTSSKIPIERLWEMGSPWGYSPPRSSVGAKGLSAAPPEASGWSIKNWAFC